MTTRSLTTILPSILLVTALGALAGFGCNKTSAPGQESTLPIDSAAAPLVLTSTDFVAGGTIPTAFSCDGDDGSPALAWSGAPTSTKSFALLVDDPDAPGGTFTHWVLFDVPAATTSLAQKTAVGVAGKNDFGNVGYGGPCPPKGKGAHHYSFRIHALDVATLGLKSGASKADVEGAMSGHVLAKGELVATFAH